MISSVPPSFFGFALGIFVIALALATWRFPQSRKARVFSFLGLYLFSLLVVLLFIFGQRQSERQFVEIGYYRSLNESHNASSPPRLRSPTLRIGNSSDQPDYIIDAECKNQPCFVGHVDFVFNQKSQGANVLTWEKSDNLIGSLRIVRPRESFIGRITDWLNFRRRASEDGLTGIELAGSDNRLSIFWEPPPLAGEEARGLLLLATVRIELTPPDAPPRITIEDPAPEVVELPNERNLSTGVVASLPVIVHLTSSDQAVALKLPDNTGYIPTIKVGKIAPRISVNAFIEQPSTPEESGFDFILNDGLRRLGNPLGERLYVGTDSGVVATVISRGNAQWTRVAIACLIIWLLPLLFFLPTILLRKDVQCSSWLYVLLPAIQMLLCVRLILGLRAYFWEPYNRVAIESAVFAALIIPLLVFIGCQVRSLHDLGQARDDEGWQNGWWRYLFKGFPPFIYWVCTVCALLLFYVLLRVSPEIVANANVLAFQDLRGLSTALPILLIVPPLIWATGFLLDRWLRAGHEDAGAVGILSVWQEWQTKVGFKRIAQFPLLPFKMIGRRIVRNSWRDNIYVGGDDDPITYAIVKTRSDSEDEDGSWTRQCWRALLFVGLATTVLGGLFLLDPGRSPFWQALLAICSFVLGVTLRRFSLYTRSINVTISVAAWSLGVVTWVVSGLLLIKAGLRYVGFRTAPEALLPGIPVRTTAAFEILILILTIRLLAAFFKRWRNAETPFRVRGLTIVFLTPMLMLMISVLASRDTGALVVHGPALLGAVLLITGSWPLWKPASGRVAALWAVFFPILLLLGYYLVISTTALTYVINDPHGTTTHRVLLREGTDVALRQAETGGQPLIGAIEQNWRMMNYAAEGGWFGRGYGNTPVPGGAMFKNITQDDLVFSIFVVSEHGALGGIALLALYVMTFFLVLRMAWDTLRSEPLRLALVGCLGLMVVFPALYMAAANVNQLVFTGQNLPLLNLRSHTEIMRTGIVMMLLLAALKPLSAVRADSGQTESRALRDWPELLRPIPGLIWQLLHRGGHQLKAARLHTLGYDPWAVAAVMASNLLLILILVATFFLFPFVGIVSTANNTKYKEELDLKPLKERAAEYVRNGQIWFEPLAKGAKAGSSCKAGAEKNRPASLPDATTAYQLCLDSNVKGGAEGDTFYFLVKGWNAREAHRGNGNGPDQKYDARQFFQLDLHSINPVQGSERISDSPLAVNQAVFHWASPFRPRIRWTGALVEADAVVGDGGVLIGESLVLPLQAAAFKDQPVFVGVNPGRAHVYLDEPRQYKAQRGFAVFEKTGQQKPIFEIDTISGVIGARLRPVSGDFDLFVNGCRVMVGDDCGKPAETAAKADRGSAPPIFLDDADVIAYAVRSNTGKRVPRHVFVYSHAQLGAFSYLTWANGKFDRFYPQGETWPMAQQVTRAISSVTKEGSALAKNDVGLTIDASLNHEVYGLLRRWRGCLDGTTPAQRCCIGTAPGDRCPSGQLPSARRVAIPSRSSRQMAVTLLDTNSGALLTLASDRGTPTNPNRSDQVAMNDGNLNLARHRIGSAIKPFTSAATLRTFPDLYKLTVVDQRKDKKKLLGLPFDGKRDLMGHSVNPDGAIEWKDFLPRSDNLYAATITMLGMCRKEDTFGLPRFEQMRNPQAPLRLVLNDNGTNLGRPVWASENMFDVSPDSWRAMDLLDKTPLAQQLEALFDVRTREPQVASYATNMWLPVTTSELLSKENVFNKVSPEITNFAFPDLVNYSDLRSVLLGGEFGDPTLGPYGRIGSAWSNVFLAQSFARISSGQKVVAYIVAQPRSVETASEGAVDWFEGAQTAHWRFAILHELEGVAMEPYGTAYKALNSRIRSIAGDRPQYAIGSEHRFFTVVGKTGTLDPDGKGALVEDSNFVFTAGIWNNGRFERAVTGAIYIEQGDEGQAQAFAAALLELLARNARFHWIEGQP